MRTILIALAAMLIGGTTYAGDVIAPPITKYVEAPLPPKRPTNFGKIDNQKVNQRIVELTTRK
jgi:hypothetical protein